MASFNLTQYFQAHPVQASAIYACGSALVATLSPWSASSGVIGAFIFVVNLIDSHITIPGALSLITQKPSIPNVTPPSQPAQAPNTSSTSSVNGASRLMLSVSNQNPKIGDTINILLNGGTPNGTYTLYLDKIPRENAAASGTQNFDASGSATLPYTLSGPGVLTQVIMNAGQVSFYALDNTTGSVSNAITLI